MTAGIITPLLLTLNMASTESLRKSVNDNRMKCHKCDLQFDSFSDLREHRIAKHPYDYVHGFSFFMLETPFTNQQEFIYRCTEYFEGFVYDEEE